jgi:hypothetical protein
MTPVRVMVLEKKRAALWYARAMPKSVLRALVCVFVLSAAPYAAAQTPFADPWTDRGYASIGFGFETVSGQLNDATIRSIYGEQGSLSVSQAVDSGAFFDFSVGARVWRNASVGIAYHQGSTESEASFEGIIPHPLFPARPRLVASTATDLKRTERAVHVQFGYMLPITERLSVHAFFGPSFFSLSQETVADVNLQELGGSFDTVNATPAIVEREDSPIGVNVGVDVSFIAYTRENLKLGGGMFIRWAGASADIELLDTDVIDSDLGGLQVGFGARIRF